MGFLLGLLKLNLELFLVLLVLGEDLVEVPLLLVKSSGGGVGPFEVDLEVLNVREVPELGLLEGSALGLSRLDQLFHLLEFLGQLLLGVFELFSPLNSISLVLGPPVGDLGVSLGQSPLELGLGFLLLFVLLPEEVVVVPGSLDGVGKGSLGLGLLFEGPLELVTVLGGRVLSPGKLSNQLFLLLNVPGELAVVSGQPGPEGVELVELPGDLIELVLGLVELVLEVPGHLLVVELGFGDGLDVAGKVIDFHLHLGLFFLKLLLDPLEVIDNLGKLADLVSLLLPQVGKGRLVRKVSLLKVPPELGHLGLPPLVELDLGSGGTGRLLKPLGQLLELPRDLRPLLLDLGPGSPLGLELLLELLNPGLELLDLLLELRRPRTVRPRAWWRAGCIRTR